MPTGSHRPPVGNLTALLVLVALLELVLHRFVGRLFLAQAGCHSVLGCLLARSGPFLSYLGGLLSLVLLIGGVAGRLGRGELFPRGVRFTVAGLTLFFAGVLLSALIYGSVPPRFQNYPETSFGFVLALLALSFAGSSAGARPRAGLAMFAIAEMLNVAATVADRMGWLGRAPVSPERMVAIGEWLILAGAASAPLLFVPGGASRTRWRAALALGGGVTAFFIAALIGRRELVQAAALFTLHLEIPPALSPGGIAYAVALLGFVTALVMLLTGSGALRLAGFGLALIGLAGYRTSSPDQLALALTGFLALATGLLRSQPGGGRTVIDPWRTFLDATAEAVSEPRDAPEGGRVAIELASEGEVDTAAIRTARRTHPVAMRVRRRGGVVQEVEITVGTPDDRPPDATVERAEVWLARPPEQRSPLPRQKTGDDAFDRVLRVHGPAPLADAALRRRVLRHAEGTLSLWQGKAARYHDAREPELARRSPLFGSRGGSSPSAVRSVVELCDLLIDFVNVDVERPGSV
jgi:hypothetical protein